MKFCDLPIGVRFKFQGEIYMKIAPCMARDEEGQGCIFDRGGFY